MSCQDVCVVMDYDCVNDFSSEAIRRAAKPHKCCECGDAIAVGDSHHYCAGKTDGEFWYERTCAPCHEIRKTFCCDGYVLLTLWDEIRDQLFPKWNEMVAIDCLARLTTDAAIAKMRAAYAQYQEDRS